MVRRAIEVLTAGAGTLLAIGGVVALAGAADGPAEGAAAVTPGSVAIAGFAFGPTDVAVAIGQPVTWTNQDGAAHTVSGGTGSPVGDSGELARGATYAVTFAAAGTYEYLCNIHPTMRGTVTVAP